MNPLSSIDQIKDCASLLVKLNRIAFKYGLSHNQLGHIQYLNILSIVCGSKSFDDFKKTSPDRLFPNFSCVSSNVIRALQRKLHDSSSLESDAKLISALTAGILRILSYVPSVEDLYQFMKLHNEREFLNETRRKSMLDSYSALNWRKALAKNDNAFKELLISKPDLVNYVHYSDSLKAISKIDVVKANFKLMHTPTYRKIIQFIHNQVVDNQDFMVLMQLVFAHKYIPLTDNNFQAKVCVADWFNDANEEGESIRLKAFHQAWVENFRPEVDPCYKFFLNDNADSFQKNITLYDTLTVYVNPGIYGEYQEIN